MGLKVFLNNDFRKFIKGEGLTSAALWKAIDEVEQGLVDAHLGGFLIKKRVPRPGSGKSGGYRTIMAYRQGERIFLLYGFAKNERDNITNKELAAFSMAAEQYIKLSDAELGWAVESKKLWALDRYR